MIAKVIPMPKPQYVLVVGPYDFKFVGPFNNSTDAANWADGADKITFDVYVLTEAEYKLNIDRFGAAPLYPPRGIRT
jgi:hypothetical protein